MADTTIQPSTPGVPPLLTLTNGVISAVSVGSAILAQLLVQLFGVQAALAAQIAIGFSVAIAVASLLRRWRRSRRKQATAVLPDDHTPGRSLLPGPLPYEKGDRLYGRLLETDQLFTLVTSSAYRFGVLAGPPGCGKTSLLRAGLLPLIESASIAPIYVPCCGDDPGAALSGCLDRVAAGAGMSAPAGDLKARISMLARGLNLPLLIICDQSEAALQRHTLTPACAAFLREVATCLVDEDLRASFLLCVRDEYWQSLQAGLVQVALPSPPLQTIGNFAPPVAALVLREAARQSGLLLEDALITSIIVDLTDSNTSVWPPALQLIAQRLMASQVRTVPGYAQVGRAAGLLASTLREEIGLSLDSTLATSILRALLPAAGFTRDAQDRTLQDLEGACASSLPTDQTAYNERVARILRQSKDRRLVTYKERVARILRQFEDRRLVARGLDDTYNLAGDFLVAATRQALEPVPITVLQADQELASYLAASSQNSSTRIPLRALWRIDTHASPPMKQQAGSLLTRSYKSAWLRGARLLGGALALVAVPVLLTTSGYGWHDGGSRGQVPATALAFDAQSQTLLVASPDNQGCGQITAWDLSGNQSQQLRQGANCPSYRWLAVSPTNGWVAATEVIGTVRLWETNDWKTLFDRDIPPPASCPGVAAPAAFSPDGHTLAIGYQCGVIRLYALSSPGPASHKDSRANTPPTITFTRALTATDMPYVGAVTFSNNSRIYAISDRAVHGWSVPDGKAVKMNPVDSITKGCASDTSCFDALIMGPNDSPWVEVNQPRSLEWWDIGTQSRIVTATWPDERSHALIVNPQALEVAASDDIATITTYRQGNGARLAIVSVDQKSDVGAFSPDGTWLVVSTDRPRLLWHGLAILGLQFRSGL